MRHRYDKEAMYLDEGERNKTKKLLLESKALDVHKTNCPCFFFFFFFVINENFYSALNYLQSVHATYTTMIGHLCSKVLKEFKVRLEKSLKEESFDSTVCASCIESSVCEFDQGCKGNDSVYVSDTSNLYPF